MYKTIGIIFAILFIIYVPIFPFGLWFNPPTGSMQPQLEGCDVLLYGPGNPEVGDVMMYWDNDETMIMHRIIEEEKNGYIFKGDNVPRPDDGTIRDEDITAELYYNIDLPIDRETCIQIFKKPYNTYYDLTNANRTLSSSSVENI